MDSLVEQTGQAPSDKSAAAAKSEEKKEEGDAKVTTSVGIGSGGVLVSLNPKANADDDPGANPDGGKSIDAIDKDEKLESEAEISPLRNGKGPMLGAFFTEHYWTKSTVGIGSLPATAAESVGGLFRYAFIPGHSFISEVGYVARNQRQGSPAWGGYDLYAGYEAKVRFDGRSTNALLLQIGLGYQRHTQKETGAIESMFVPRGRIGIRHVFGKGFGLEFAGDVGHASIWLVDTGLRTDSWILGGEIAALVGF